MLKFYAFQTVLILTERDIFSLSYIWYSCIIISEEPSKAAIKNKKKREAKARKKQEEQQSGVDEASADDGLSSAMRNASLDW